MEASSIIDIESEEFKNFEHFLKKYPHVFQTHRRLLSHVTPPRRTLDEKVIDFQKEHINYLQTKCLQFEEVIDALLEGHDDNEKQLMDVHQSILRLLQTDSMEELYSVISEELSQILNIDHIDLCLACPHQKLWAFIPYASAIMINDFFKEQNIILRSHIDEEDLHFFGNDYLSDALVKIDIPSHHIVGVLHLASYQDNMFDETQKTTFLEFMRDVITLTIEKYAEIEQKHPSNRDPICLGS